MRIEILREFVVLVKHKNYSSAARELYCSQPNISNHMAALEKELGFKLLVRQGDRLNLTQAGREFLKAAQSIILTYEKSLLDCRALALSAPPVRIQSVAQQSPIYQLLQIHCQTPFVFIDINFNTNLFDALDKDLVDIGFSNDFSGIPALVSEAKRHGLAWFSFGESPVALCFMNTHPLAKKTELCRQDLYGATVRIHSGQQFDCWKLIVQTLLGDDLSLDFVLDPVDSLSSISMLDLEETVYICGKENVTDLFSNRNDVTICTELLDCTLDAGHLFVYRDDGSNGHVSALVSEIRAAALSPSRQLLAL